MSSSSSSAATTSYHYKKDLVNRMGGPSQYTKVQLDWSMRLREEPRLKPFYGHFSVKVMTEIHFVFLDLALVVVESCQQEKINNLARIELYHYRLYEQGWNSSHFEVMKIHLRDALLHTWVETDIVKEILDCFEELQSQLFRKGGCITLVKESKLEKEWLTSKLYLASMQSQQTKGLSKRDSLPTIQQDKFPTWRL